MATSRANAFGDLNDFQPKPPQAHRIKDEQIEQDAESLGFPSRQAPAARPAPLVSKRTLRRHTTGRNQQLNVKATPGTIARFYRLADERQVVLEERLERALEALEKAGL